MSHPDSPQAPTPAVVALCLTVWVASYTLPLYALPITMFAGMWLAAIVWGLALSGSQPASAAVRWADARTGVALAVPVLLGALAVRGQPAEALNLWVAAAVMALGLFGPARPWRTTLLWAVFVAAALNAALAVVQIYAPDQDLPFVAALAVVGRATGNLRQPNHLATLLMLGIVAAMMLAGRARGGRVQIFHAAVILFGVASAFSRSRTAWLGLALLLAWVVMDRSLSRTVRRLPWLALAGLVAGFALLALQARTGGADFYLHQPGTGGDVSSSRFGIWANALELVRQHPWAGVGWGELGTAWALTPFPGRPVAAFDHAHNLVLQWVVELGLPLGLGLAAAGLWTLWRARHGWSAGDEAQRLEARGTWMLVLLLLSHSMHELPLWSTYFLLPFAYWFGTLVRLGIEAEPGVGTGGAVDRAAPATPVDGAHRLTGPLLKAAGVLIVFGSLYVAWDYMRVIQAFKPFGPGLRQSLEQRVHEGRKSVLFGYWVDYGVVTNAEQFATLREPLRRALHNHVNPHLLMVYAQALHERGEDDKAAFVAERVREFRHEVSAGFLAVCEQVPEGQAVPFQCRKPERSYVWTEFD